jgi:carboxymethylenebutenolidase
MLNGGRHPGAVTRLCHCGNAPVCDGEADAQAVEVRSAPTRRPGMNDLQRYLVDEAVEDYEEGRTTRRDALRIIAGLTGIVLASQILDAHAQLVPAPVAAAPKGVSIYHVEPNDPDIIADMVEIPGAGVQLSGYLARPSRNGRAPVVLVCHENRGLTAHIQDVTRRVAKAGYVGLAMDLLAREGGTVKHEYDAIPGVLGKVAPERHTQDFQSGLAYAKAQPFARSEGAGMVGFCFGGGVTWRMAAATPELRAAVPFYGQPVQVEDVPKVQGAILGIYAGRDKRINDTVPAIEAAMKENNKTFHKIVYPEVDHAFHNDTVERYNQQAAQAAWEQTLVWLRRYLKPEIA